MFKSSSIPVPPTYEASKVRSLTVMNTVLDKKYFMNAYTEVRLRKLFLWQCTRHNNCKGWGPSDIKRAARGDSQK
jgi:hypothetical protein